MKIHVISETGTNCRVQVVKARNRRKKERIHFSILGKVDQPTPVDTEQEQQHIRVVELHGRPVGSAKTIGPIFLTTVFACKGETLIQSFPSWVMTHGPERA